MALASYLNPCLQTHCFCVPSHTVVSSHIFWPDRLLQPAHNVGIGAAREHVVVVTVVILVAVNVLVALLVAVTMAVVGTVTVLGIMFLVEVHTLSPTSASQLLGFKQAII